MTSNLVYSKDSFDRFGDDLCELLLSFLSNSHKIYFECVSKQWKRLVFNKQKKLIISFQHLVYNNNCFETILAKKDLNYGKPVIEILLKKFKFINDLEINDRFGINEDINTLDIIRNNCHFLHSLCIEGKIKDFDSTVHKLDKDFGQRLRSISMRKLTEDQMQTLLRLTPNVKTICSSHKLIVFIDSYLPKLERINRLLVKDINAFTLFTNKYYERIKKLSHLYVFIKNPEVSQQLSRFINIEELVLDLNCLNAMTNEEIVSIGVNCEKLKYLTLKVYHFGLNINLFQVFSGFHSLEKLSIYLHTYNVNIQSLEPLKNCKNIKSFDSRIYGLKDKHLDQINSYLPQLKHLSLTGLNSDITDKTLQSLAQMKELSKLRLIASELTDSGVCNFIKNSPNIKSIQLYNNFINETTVKAFIERSKTKPKVKFEFLSVDYALELDMNVRLALPHNLTLKQID
jgi:hypothetical protein